MFSNQIEIVSCFFMTGIIWLVQLVHYPSFLYIDRNRFESFCRFHQQRISFIVMPAMCLELVANIWTYMQSSQSVLYLLSSLALYAIWLITFFISMPYHRQLSQAFDKMAVLSLIRTNWLRTLLWTVRSCLFFYHISLVPM